MSENRTEVVGGVDTHRDVHVAAAVDAAGALLGTASFPADGAGYEELAAWLGSWGRPRCVGVEGTGSYGAGLARRLAAAGISVVEVNRPNRQERRRRGKSDALDAQAAARAALGGHAAAVPKTHDGPVEAIRMLTVARRGAVKARTQAANQLHGLLTTAPEQLKGHLSGLEGRALLDACAAPGPADGADAIPAAATTALSSLARRHQALTAEIADLDGELQALCAQANPALLAATGVGAATAAALLIAAGDNPGRLRNEASFAALCGTSPIEASSGKTTRHRLNRGGNRHANQALWRIAMVRLRCDPTTQAYANRRRAEGKTTRETIRCLKRHIAREIYRLLTNPPPVPHGDDLRRRRAQANITLTAAAKAIGSTTSRLSALERGTHHNTTLANNYQHWLTQNTP